jgi:hypothetical protein
MRLKSVCSTRPSGRALSSLMRYELADRFYSWQGASGSNYVCTVFQEGDEARVADFEGAAVIGVAYRKNGRRPVCIMEPRALRLHSGQSMVRLAAKRGVNEWHVHFTSDWRKLSKDLGLVRT